MTAYLLPAGEMDRLLDALRARGLDIIGPRLREGQIGYGEVRSAADFPIGWTHETEAGRYALQRRDDGAFFGYAVSAASLKRWLRPPREVLWTAERRDDGVDVTPTEPTPPRTALIGPRGCDLAAALVLARVLGADSRFEAHRNNLFVVAVDCFVSASTCFCASTLTGPSARDGFDLALSELVQPEHVFLVRAGSEAGAELVEELRLAPAPAGRISAANDAIDAAAASQQRALAPEVARRVLATSARSRVWDELDQRCLACTNCTSVCPTCFCSTTETVTDLEGLRMQQTRVWDSCFSPEFSYMHGGAVRRSRGSRYRQWITHKLSTWHDQFGESGCVGCGRCITYCPVGIDIVAEVERLEAQEQQ